MKNHHSTIPIEGQAETDSAVRFDKKIWTGPALSRLIVYALDVGHLVLATRPVEEYERVALFKERARASVTDGQYSVEFPRKVYDFHRLDETEYTVMASETKPRTVEILL